MTKAAAPPWEAKRTEETRRVEEVLKKAGFQQADAYRYNSASIRVRVIDPHFQGKSAQDRDAMVEPLLDQLPEPIQADIMNLLTLYPGETDTSVRARLLNLEFEDPRPSML